MLNIHIRPLHNDELSILDLFLYEAIFQPDPINKISKDILQVPEIKVYIENFGSSPHDYCLVAQHHDKIVGAAWNRILNGSIKGYGNIDDHTPEIAISVIEEYRNNGIGYNLLLELFEQLRNKGYKQVSLSVNKQNYAYLIYKKNRLRNDTGKRRRLSDVIKTCLTNVFFEDYVYF